MACVYTKQFSDTTVVEPTEENTSKVVGQIIKNERGKTIFQIIAMTEDMELAGKTKNTLIKMGYADAKDEVKTFSNNDRQYFIQKGDKVLNINKELVDLKTCPPDEIGYFEDHNDAIKYAMEINGTVMETK